MNHNQLFRPLNYLRPPYLVSTEADKIDVDMVHRFLARESYWTPGIAKSTVERALKHSLCFGLYDCTDGGEVQIGFARAISDYARFAYLSDVFILAHYRGNGLGKWLVSCILAHPELRLVGKWMLNTRDAQDLYQRFGFSLHVERDSYMVYRPVDREF